MSSSFPNFTDSTLFPPFSATPQISSPPTSSNDEDYFLLGTILENMTLTPLTPTFICRDRSGANFAVTIKLRPGQDSDNDERSFYKSKEGRVKFRKGACIAVNGAKRKNVKESDEDGKGGKPGFVEVGWEEGGGGIAVIPASVEKLFEISENISKASKADVGSKACHGCGNVEGEMVRKMVRCKGCESVWYCGKECQVKGWSENSHKEECKVLKAANDIFR